MNENLPQKYKDNVFQRLLKKIRALFFKKADDFETENINIKTRESDFDNKIRVTDNLKSIYDEKKQFMKNLVDHPELLENFSNDKLEKILEYYENENNEKREILNKLTA